MALGDFGTRVLGIGQKRGEVKVYRARSAQSALTEAQWGRRAKTRFYPTSSTSNDLQRRVNEDANRAVEGRQADGAGASGPTCCAPFDGWDIGDNIVDRHRTGAWSTPAQYGSGGYWTIYGVEWRYYPDGHTDLTLTILPKKTTTPPTRT